MIKILLLALFLTCTSPAAELCQSLFNNFNPKGASTSRVQANLEKFGFVQKGNEIYRTSHKNKLQLIGTVYTIKPKYLFEWANKDMHDYWSENGGYLKDDMDYTLTLPGQMSGKGYYVSVNPSDSQNFGTYLTIFKPTQPLIIFKWIENKRLNWSNENLLNELRQIGFSGVEGVSVKNWLTLFNEYPISRIQELNAEITTELQIQFPTEIDLLKRLRKPQFRKLK